MEETGDGGEGDDDRLGEHQRWRRCGSAGQGPTGRSTSRFDPNNSVSTTLGPTTWGEVGLLLRSGSCYQTRHYLACGLSEGIGMFRNGPEPIKLGHPHHLTCRR